MQSIHDVGVNVYFLANQKQETQLLACETVLCCNLEDIQTYTCTLIKRKIKIKDYDYIAFKKNGH